MRPVYLHGRGLASTLGANLSQALAYLSDGGRAPQRMALPGGTNWPYFGINHAEPDWRARAQQLVHSAIQEAGVKSCRDAPLFVASSSFDIGAIEIEMLALHDEASTPLDPSSPCSGLNVSSKPIHLSKYSKQTGFKGCYSFAKEIADWLGWSGPVYAVSSACTSSLQALLAASKLISSGPANDAVVIGIELANHFSVSGFAAMQLLTPSEPRPLESNRDGIALGEAVSVLHLSALPARWRLCGGSNITDGRDPTGAIPQTVTQMCAQALAASGLKPTDIDLIKLQAAGSPINDANELTGLASIFEPLPPLVTFKSAIGHTLGASGAAELSLLTACLETQIWPHPTYHPDNGLPARLAPARPESVRYLLANILGFGGGHTAVILEDMNA